MPCSYFLPRGPCAATMRSVHTHFVSQVNDIPAQTSSLSPSHLLTCLCRRPTSLFFHREKFFAPPASQLAAIRPHSQKRLSYAIEPPFNYSFEVPPLSPLSSRNLMILGLNPDICIVSFFIIPNLKPLQRLQRGFKSSLG